MSSLDACWNSLYSSFEFLLFRFKKRESTPKVA